MKTICYLCAFIVLSGCATSTSGGEWPQWVEKTPDAHTEQLPYAYDGPECDAVFTDQYSSNIPETISDAVLSSVCAKYTGKLKENALAKPTQAPIKYRKFQLKDISKPYHRADVYYVKHGSTPSERAIVGLVSYLTNQELFKADKFAINTGRNFGLAMAGVFATSDESIVDDMRTEGVSEPVIRAMLKNLDVIRSREEELHQAFGPEFSEIFIDAPVRAFKTYDTYIASGDPIVHEILTVSSSLDDMVTPTQDAMTNLEELRGNFLNHCGEGTQCRSEMPYVRATTALISANQKLKRTNYVEYNKFILLEAFTYNKDLNHMIHNEQLISGFALAEESRKPGSTKEFKFDNRAHSPFSLPISSYMDRRKASDSFLQDEVVKVVKAGDGQLKITFKQESGKGFEPYDCVYSNRIDRIDDKGKVYYKRKCKWKEITVDNKKWRPVIVIDAGTQDIKVGDKITVELADVEKRTAWLMQVERDEDMLFSIKASVN